MKKYREKSVWTVLLVLAPWTAWANPGIFPWFPFIPAALLALALLAFFRDFADTPKQKGRLSSFLRFPSWSPTSAIILALVMPPIMAWIYFAVLVVNGCVFTIAGLICAFRFSRTGTNPARTFITGLGMLGGAAILALAIYLTILVILNPYPKRPRATRALGDIQGMELALAKMLSDAKINSFNAFFNRDAVADYLADGIIQGGDKPIRITTVLTAEQFHRAQLLYTHTFYALLREGSLALTDGAIDEELKIRFGDILDPIPIGKLRPEYLQEIAFDPWGNIYQLFPGPWPNNTNPFANALQPNGNLNIFRTYIQTDKLPTPPGARIQQNEPDALTVNFDPSKPASPAKEVVDPDMDESYTFGYPAPRDMMVFIYSFGQNMVSGQAIYSNAGYSWDSYDDNQEPMYWGGGDDINNWDREQTWMWFYT